MIWNETIECASREYLSELQSKRLRDCVNRVYHNVPYYRKRMQEAGILPGDIRTIDDLKKLPFTYKQDLRDNYPFGVFAAPMSEIVRLHASSGTTGRPTVVGRTRKDLDIWSECVARALSLSGVTNKDIVQVGYGYGLFTGGLGLHYGVEKVGATVLPSGTGGTERQLELMMDLGVTAIACTPSYLVHMGDVAQKMGIDFRRDTKLKRAILGAEPWTEGMRKHIEETMGIKAYDIYGTSEMAGPMYTECEERNGIHMQSDTVYVEIIDPDTGEVLPEGEKGELVFTALDKEAFPLLRYRTRDICVLSRRPCSCGRTHVRMSKPMGRSDDMLIIRGVNVFPSQIETVLLNEGYTPNYQIVLDRERNNDTFDVYVEVSSDQFSDLMSQIQRMEKNLESALRTMLGIGPKVHLVAPKTITRSEGKAVRVIDKRKLHD